MNNPEDHWVVCLGVPYETALWQVGNSGAIYQYCLGEKLGSFYTKKEIV